MNRIPLDIGPQFSAQRLVGDQIHRPAKQVLPMELDPKVSLRRCGSIEAHKNVDVAGAFGKTRGD
jgi:hypothetical protein